MTVPTTIHESAYFGGYITTAAPATTFNRFWFVKPECLPQVTNCVKKRPEAGFSLTREQIYPC